MLFIIIILILNQYQYLFYSYTHLMKLYAFFALITFATTLYIIFFPFRPGQLFIALALFFQPMVLAFYEIFIVRNKYKQNP